jgi:hypothetical protein
VAGAANRPCGCPLALPRCRDPIEAWLTATGQLRSSASINALRKRRHSRRRRLRAMRIAADHNDWQAISRSTGEQLAPIRPRAYLDCPGLSEMTIVVIHARANSNFCVIASSVKPNRTSFVRSSASLCSEQAPRRSNIALRSRSSLGPVLISPSEVVTVIPQMVHTAEKSSPSAVRAAITRMSVKSISWPRSVSVSQNGLRENTH